MVPSFLPFVVNTKDNNTRKRSINKTKDKRPTVMVRVRVRV
jgi:hypothetical protein